MKAKHVSEFQRKLSVDTGGMHIVCISQVEMYSYVCRYIHEDKQTHAQAARYTNADEYIQALAHAPYVCVNYFMSVSGPCESIRMHVCTCCVCMYIYVHIHIHILMYLHTHSQRVSMWDLVLAASGALWARGPYTASTLN